MREPVGAPVIHPNRTFWLPSAAHGVNHAQAVILPMPLLAIIDAFHEVRDPERPSVAVPSQAFELADSA